MTTATINTAAVTKTEMLIRRPVSEGFSLLIAGAKAYLEHKIQLNLVADRFPKGIHQ